MIILYGLKNCDTCRKVARALNVKISDVRDEELSADQLSQFHAVLGDSILNTRSTTWRGLSEDARKQPVVELLAAHPALMKRPVIDSDGTLYLGWGKDVQDALLPE